MSFPIGNFVSSVLGFSTSFDFCCKAGLMVLFLALLVYKAFYFSVKSEQEPSLLGILSCTFLPFITLNMSCLLACSFC